MLGTFVTFFGHSRDSEGTWSRRYRGLVVAEALTVKYSSLYSQINNLQRRRLIHLILMSSRPNLHNLIRLSFVIIIFSLPPMRFCWRYLTCWAYFLGSERPHCTPRQVFNTSLWSLGLGRHYSTSSRLLPPLPSVVIASAWRSRFMLFCFSVLDSPRRSTYSRTTLLHRGVQADDNMSVVTNHTTTDPVGARFVYTVYPSRLPRVLVFELYGWGLKGERTKENFKNIWTLLKTLNVDGNQLVKLVWNS